LLAARTVSRTEAKMFRSIMVGGLGSGRAA
jgi:hypothetical protein